MLGRHFYNIGLDDSIVYGLKVNQEQLGRAKRFLAGRESYLKIACVTLLRLPLIVSSVLNCMRETPSLLNCRVLLLPLLPNVKMLGS